MLKRHKDISSMHKKDMEHIDYTINRIIKTVLLHAL